MCKFLRFYQSSFIIATLACFPESIGIARLLKQEPEWFWPLACGIALDLLAYCSWQYTKAWHTSEILAKTLQHSQISPADLAEEARQHFLDNLTRPAFNPQESADETAQAQLERARERIRQWNYEQTGLHDGWLQPEQDLQHFQVVRYPYELFPDVGRPNTIYQVPENGDRYLWSEEDTRYYRIDELNRIIPDPVPEPEEVKVEINPIITRPLKKETVPIQPNTVKNLLSRRKHV